MSPPQARHCKDPQTATHANWIRNKRSTLNRPAEARFHQQGSSIVSADYNQLTSRQRTVLPSLRTAQPLDVHRAALPFYPGRQPAGWTGLRHSHPQRDRETTVGAYHPTDQLRNEQRADDNGCNDSLRWSAAATAAVQWHSEPPVTAPVAGLWRLNRL